MGQSLAAGVSLVRVACFMLNVMAWKLDVLSLLLLVKEIPRKLKGSITKDIIFKMLIL